VPSPPAILQVSDLRMDFGGFRALDGVDLRVQEGTLHAIIGPNGAGKTTLFNKLMAAVLSCMLSGLAGGISVANHGFVALDAVHWSTSGLVVIMVLLGGMGTRLGPLVGAAFVLLLRDFLSTWTDAWGVLTGGIFVIVILIFRQGIVGTLESVLASKRPLVAAPPAAAEETASTSRT